MLVILNLMLLIVIFHTDNDFLLIQQFDGLKKKNCPVLSPENLTSQFFPPLPIYLPLFPVKPSIQCARSTKHDRINLANINISLKNDCYGGGKEWAGPFFPRGKN